MAAIIPHQEVTDDTTPIERAYDTCAGSPRGRGLGDAGASCPPPSAVLADAHAGLLGLVFVRDAVVASLAGREYTVQVGNREGTERNAVYLVLADEKGGIGPGPAWNPTTDPTVSQYQLLSWTSKMNAPSWSIPAGAPQLGGSCPGAVAGQSIAPDTERAAAAKLVNIGLRRPVGTPVNLAASICQRCYATGGQYSTGQVQYAQVLRYLWARQAIEVKVPGPRGMSTAFVETMVYAIDNANYRLQGGKVTTKEDVVDPDTGEIKTVKKAEWMSPEPTGRRFFRIHDSGDFFSKNYLRQWKQIADRIPDVTFWAPSRIWATQWGIDLVNEINAPRSGSANNLIIRPSAYEINAAGPCRLGPGWAAPTTVIAAEGNLGMTPELEEYVYSKAQRVDPVMTGPDPRYDWNCQAYAVDDKGHTCRKAVAPPGYGGPDGKGCRACWIAPDASVNYTLH